MVVFYVVIAAFVFAESYARTIPESSAYYDITCRPNSTIYYMGNHIDCKLADGESVCHQLGLFVLQKMKCDGCCRPTSTVSVLSKLPSVR